MITVFYDGKCGLCSKEINHYKKIAPKGVFDWQDITESTEALTPYGITLAEGLKYLHVRDEKGAMHIGVDAFILIWRQLARWRVVAFFVALPLIHPLAKLAYRAFANQRFNRLEHCQLAAKQDDV